MINPVLIAIAAGVSLGVVLGFRFGKALVLKVGGPFARKPIVVGCAVIGGCGFLVQAVLYTMFVGARLHQTFGAVVGGAAGSGSLGVLAGIAAGTALVITSGLVVSVFSGALCGRLIEDFRSMS
jgi:hypothetical protein